MEYLKKEIRTFQNGKTVNDQFYIDDDYNVPDAKKDVGRIIISDGTLQVEEMKQVENYLKRYRSLQAWKEGFHLKK